MSLIVRKNHVNGEGTAKDGGYQQPCLGDAGAGFYVFYESRQFC